MNKLRSFILIVNLTAILIVQQLSLAFIPNVSLTTFLIILYSKVLRVKETSIIIVLYSFIFNLISPNGVLLYTHYIFIVIAWLFIPLSLNTIFRSDNILFLSLFSLFYAMIFGLIMAIPSVFITKIPFKIYLLSDLPFQIIMGFSNFIIIYLLYEKTYNTFKNIILKYNSYQR